MNVEPQSNLPPCKNERDLLYRYLHNVFQPALAKAWSDVDLDYHTGCIGILVQSEGKTFTLYATPFWENNVNNIPLQISDENGDNIECRDLPYSIDNWTMDVKRDVENYMFTVQLWMKTVLPSVLWKMKMKKA